MKNVIGAALGAIAFTAACPAFAQVAGTYSGTSADGSGVSYQVSTDSATGALALTGASIGYNAPCKGASVSSGGGWGFGLTSDIVNRKVTETTYGGNFNFFVKLTFSKDGQSATGTIESIVTTLYPTATKATKALFCESPTQALTLTLQPASSARKPVAQAAYLYDQKGRIIGTISR